MSPAVTASLPALQPPAYQRHDTPLASSRSPMVGCVSGCFMTVLTRCGGGRGWLGGVSKRRGGAPPPLLVAPPPPAPARVRREESSAARAVRAHRRTSGGVRPP